MPLHQYVNDLNTYYWNLSICIEQLLAQEVCNYRSFYDILLQAVFISIVRDLLAPPATHVIQLNFIRRVKALQYAVKN